MSDLSAATRPVYWNVQGVWLMYALFAVALVICGYGVYRRVSVWRRGKPDASRLSEWWPRLRTALAELLLQKRVRGSRLPGLVHSLAFYSFLVLVLATAAVFLQADFGVHLFHGPVYVLLSLGADIAGALILFGVAIAAWRRLVSKPSSIESCPADWVALGFLALLVLTGFLVEGLRIATIGDRWAALSPVGWLTSLLFGGISRSAGEVTHQALWWSHTALALGWIASLPYTKFFHLLAIPTNVYFSKTKPRGELQRLDIEAIMESEAEDFQIGVEKAADFTWKQRLDFDACVSCGRCEEVCPATLAGHPFSPRLLIQRSRDLVAGRLTVDAKNGGAPRGAETIVGDTLDQQFIWYCRTCTACMEACPAAIDHVDTLMEMRRNEFMIQGRVPHEAGQALKLLENTGNPFGRPAERGDFIQKSGLRVVAPGEDVDVLFWIGCCTTFDPTKQKIATDLFAILDACGVSYGVLGEDERCCGDPARLIGDERLFQEIAKAEVAAINARSFRVLLVNCPHCYNVLAREYAQFGGHYNVVHHTQLLHEMLWSGDLVPTEGRRSRIVYHDPCYLGRYQKIYDAPREVLHALPGATVTEMGDDYRAHSLCCGGGGGHYWMDLKAGKERINNLRVDEAQKEGADTIVTSCPYCQQMLNDSVKSRDLDDKIRVVDIATAVLETLGPEVQPKTKPGTEPA